MRFAHALGTALSLAVLCAAIVASGRQLGPDGEAGMVAVEEIDQNMLAPAAPEEDAAAEALPAPAAEPPAEPSEEAVEEPAREPGELGDRLTRRAPPAAKPAPPAAKPAPPTAAPAPPAAAPAPPAAAPAAPTVAEPRTTATLQRIAPRKPLSTLGQAKEPEPEEKADWDGTSLYRPVATAAGTFEAMGYTVSLAGTQPIGPDETCSYKGADWPCGVRARTEFRQLLRGRAVVCAMPEGAEAGSVAVDCRIGTENLGAWLVENGWARAAPGSPYAEAGRKAEADGKGIFGAPPR